MSGIELAAIKPRSESLNKHGEDTAYAYLVALLEVMTRTKEGVIYGFESLPKQCYM
jgi:hypothetical protein